MPAPYLIQVRPWASRRIMRYTIHCHFLYYECYTGRMDIDADEGEFR